MATVGAVDCVDRFHRTPEELVKALFHDPRADDSSQVPTRPRPQYKRACAQLTCEDEDGEVVQGLPAVFVWVDHQVLPMVGDDSGGLLHRRPPAGAGPFNDEYLHVSPLPDVGHNTYVQTLQDTANLRIQDTNYNTLVSARGAGVDSPGPRPQ
jgi:hypothetical protein